MAFRYCNHIKSDGIQCHSPAMRDKKYCFYHAQYRRRIVPTKHTPGALTVPMVDGNRNYVEVEVQEPCAQRYKLGTLEDGPALQVALSTVINALADNRIDIGRANTLLYGLQLASTNLRSFDLAEPPATHTQLGTSAQVPEPEELTAPPETQTQTMEEDTAKIDPAGKTPPTAPA